MGRSSLVLYPAPKIPRCQRQSPLGHLENSRCEMIDLVNYLPCTLGFSSNLFHSPQSSFPSKTCLSCPQSSQLICYSPRVTLGQSLSSQVPHKRFRLKDAEPLITSSAREVRAGEQRAAARNLPHPRISLLLPPDGEFFMSRFHSGLSQVRRDIKNAWEHSPSKLSYRTPCLVA